VKPGICPEAPRVHSGDGKRIHLDFASKAGPNPNFGPKKQAEEKPEAEAEEAEEKPEEPKKKPIAKLAGKPKPTEKPKQAEKPTEKPGAKSGAKRTEKPGAKSGAKAAESATVVSDGEDEEWLKRRTPAEQEFDEWKAQLLSEQIEAEDREAEEERAAEAAKAAEEAAKAADAAANRKPKRPASDALHAQAYGFTTPPHPHRVLWPSPNPPHPLQQARRRRAHQA